MKTRMNFTIDKTIASRFSRLCKEQGWNKSQQIEKIIDSIIKKNS